MARAGNLLPTETSPRALESEERLLLAVLEQAVADLDDPCPAVRAEAGAYIFEYVREYSVFSFDAVCAHFKLSPEAVREALRHRPPRRPRARSGARCQAA